MTAFLEILFELDQLRLISLVRLALHILNLFLHSRLSFKQTLTELFVLQCKFFKVSSGVGFEWVGVVVVLENYLLHAFEVVRYLLDFLDQLAYLAVLLLVNLDYFMANFNLQILNLLVQRIQTGLLGCHNFVYIRLGFCNWLLQVSLNLDKHISLNSILVKLVHAICQWDAHFLFYLFNILPEFVLESYSHLINFIFMVIWPIWPLRLLGLGLNILNLVLNNLQSIDMLPGCLLNSIVNLL